MLDRGFLVAGGFYPTLAHEENSRGAVFWRPASRCSRNWLRRFKRGDIEPRIGGPVKHTGFRRLV